MGFLTYDDEKTVDAVVIENELISNCHAGKIIKDVIKTLKKDVTKFISAELEMYQYLIDELIR